MLYAKQETRKVKVKFKFDRVVEERKASENKSTTRLLEVENLLNNNRQ